MREIEIPEEGLEGIRYLLQLGAEGIDAFREAIETTGPSLLAPGPRSVLIEEAMPSGVAVETERILVYVLHPLFMVQQGLEISPEELHSSVGDTLQRAKEGTWESSDTAKWQALKQPLLKLLSSSVAQIEAKALALLRQRANRVQSLKVFTDTRPVFDELRETVAAVLVIDTLRIRFQDGSESRVMHFSLDPSDLDELETQITRAKKKHQGICKSNKQLDAPTLMVARDINQHSDSEQEQ